MTGRNYTKDASRAQAGKRAAASAEPAVPTVANAATGLEAHDAETQNLMEGLKRVLPGRTIAAPGAGQCKIGSLLATVTRHKTCFVGRPAQRVAMTQSRPAPQAPAGSREMGGWGNAGAVRSRI